MQPEIFSRAAPGGGGSPVNLLFSWYVTLPAQLLLRINRGMITCFSLMVCYNKFAEKLKEIGIGICGGGIYLDKFCDALDNFFCFVRRHYGAFYWICWAYIITLGVLQIVFEFADVITAVAIIPMNLLTWPIFLETRKMKDIPFRAKRNIFGLLVMSTLFPLYFFFKIL